MQFLRGQEVVGGGEGVGDRGPAGGGADTGDRARFGVVEELRSPWSGTLAVCPVRTVGSVSGRMRG